MKTCVKWEFKLLFCLKNAREARKLMKFDLLEKKISWKVLFLSLKNSNEFVS